MDDYKQTTKEYDGVPQFIKRGQAQYGRTVTLDNNYIPKNSEDKKVAPCGMRVGLLASNLARPATGKKAASLSIDCTNPNADFVVTAKETGSVGNNISVALVDPSANDAALAVSVNGTAISVSLATNGSGTITSTASQVIAAINASDAANDLVVASLASGHDGSGVVEAKSETSLSGGTDGYASVTVDCTNANSDFVVTADKPGSAANDLSIVLVDPSGNDKPLSVDYDDGTITVNLATNGSGTITSTASEVIAAINADVECKNLVTASLASGSTGAGVVEAKAEASFTGGADPTEAVGLLAEEVDCTDGNSAATLIVGGIVSEAALPRQIATANDHPWTDAQKTELRKHGNFIFEA